MDLWLRLYPSPLFEVCVYPLDVWEGHFPVNNLLRHICVIMHKGIEILPGSSGIRIVGAGGTAQGMHSPVELVNRIPLSQLVELASRGLRVVRKLLEVAHGENP